MIKSKEEKNAEDHLTRLQNDMLRKADDEKLRYIITEGVIINFFETVLNIIPKNYKVINTYQYAQVMKPSALQLGAKPQTMIFYVAVLERDGAIKTSKPPYIA